MVLLFQKRFGKDPGALPSPLAEHKCPADLDARRISQIRL